MSPSIVEVEVVYKWKPTRSLFNCNSNQSCSVRDVMGLKVELVDISKPLELDGVGIGSRHSPSGPLLNVHNALGLKLRPDSELPSCHTFGSYENSLGSAKDFQEETLSSVGLSEACPVKHTSVDDDHLCLPMQDHALVEQSVPAFGDFGIMVELSSHRALIEMAKGVLAGSSQGSYTELVVGCCKEPARKVEPDYALVLTPSDCSSLLPMLDPKSCRHQLLQDAQFCSQAGIVARLVESDFSEMTVGNEERLSSAVFYPLELCSWLWQNSCNWGPAARGGRGVGGTAMPFRCWQLLLPSNFLKREASNLTSLECDYQFGAFGVGS
ncbi:hypothetical protein Nepgr_014751 [Nepenthes gracilis]|uniref:Uncharacterized protein n=1 Tax=Nepenthes gracilis TaxID=150966 RepID=A0AAD3SLH6_NEPGR|nr:hypothetical protein Nepgr_014751 [Nepenthes gracilis]